MINQIALILYYLLFVWFLYKANKLPQWYIIILYFIVFRMVFDYNKCTISYIECKLRGVPKKFGYIYQFLQSINDLRNNSFMFYISIIMAVIVTWKYFIIDKCRIII